VALLNEARRILLTSPQIYLEQLSSITVPIPSLTRASASGLSISSLALSRPFPSSRSSFLSIPPSSSGLGPPDSTSGSAYERQRDGFDRDHEPGKQKSTRRPVFSEQDLHLLRRNAQDLLAWHEQFVSILKQALFPLGFGWVFARVSDRRGRELRSSSEDLALQKIDEAVSVVMEAFAQQVSMHNQASAYTCGGANPDDA
jgi:hypothetical protein